MVFVHSRAYFSILYMPSISLLWSDSQKKGGRPGTSLYAVLVICAAVVDYKSPEAITTRSMERRLVSLQSRYPESLTRGAQIPHIHWPKPSSVCSRVRLWTFSIES